MGTELQVRLTGLSAPGPLLDLVQPHPDLESWWKACPSPELLLWLAARLCTTDQQRRVVLSCLAELNRRAQHGARRLDPRTGLAVAAAEAWAQGSASDEARLDELLAAERGALAAAAAADVQAIQINARARALFRCAPRARAASFSNSRALGALADWREADRARRLALAAAGAARAAAEAARAEARGSAEAGSGGASTMLTATRPDSWAASVGESAGYAAGALAPSRPSPATAPPGTPPGWSGAACPAPSSTDLRHRAQGATFPGSGVIR